MNLASEQAAVPAGTTGRHAMVVHAYYPLGETRVEREAQALLEQGIQVDVICLRDAGERPVEWVDGVQVFRLPVRRSKRRGFAIQLLEYLAFFTLASIRLIGLTARRRYQVIQAHNLPDFLIFCGLVPRWLGTRLILDIHDLMPEFMAARLNRSLDSWPVRLVRWQEALACRFADHVITVSEPWRQTLGRRGVPLEKISVVMNVADERIFSYQGSQGSQGSPGGRPAGPPEDGTLRLIYHGTIVHRYGLDLAVRAVHQLRERIPGIHLTILGKGDFVEPLRQMVAEFNLEDQVTILDELRPAAELPALIRAADLGIVPYRNDPFTDGLLPTKLMEYAALGLPAVAARTTAIETFFGGTMVHLFEPGDIDDLARGLVTLVEDPAYLAQLAQGCRRFNEQYNWTRIGAAYVNLVRRLGRFRPAAA